MCTTELFKVSFRAFLPCVRPSWWYARCLSKKSRQKRRSRSSLLTENKPPSWRNVSVLKLSRFCTLRRRKRKQLQKRRTKVFSVRNIFKEKRSKSDFSTLWRSYDLVFVKILLKFCCIAQKWGKLERVLKLARHSQM